MYEHTDAPGVVNNFSPWIWGELSHYYKKQVECFKTQHESDIWQVANLRKALNLFLIIGVGGVGESYIEISNLFN